MITSIDTNVIIALWDRDLAISSAAQSALDNALERGGLVVGAPQDGLFKNMPPGEEENGNPARAVFWLTS